MLGDDIKVGDKIKFNALALESITNKAHPLYKYVGKVLTITVIYRNDILFTSKVAPIDKKYFDKYKRNTYIGVTSKSTN